jgi:NodT family efflux transporter outer membrane factor (OMF) lipoprotein
MFRHCLIVAGLGSSLAACNLAPGYHPPLVAVPAAYKEVGPWKPAQPSDMLPRSAWWLRLGDNTLNELEPQVDAANPGLEATVARYDQARAFAAEAEAGLFPQVSLGGSQSANKQSKDRPLRSASGPNYYNANQIGVQATYEVDIWGKIRNAVSAGKSLAQASAADLATMRLSLQAELATDYFMLRGLDADTKLLADTVTAYQKALDLTEILFKGKIASNMDVSRAQTQLSLARAQVSDLAGRRALLEHAIATLVGQPAASFSIAAKVLPFVLADVPIGIPSTLLQRRSDIASAERTMNAANAEIGVARAAFYPDVSLNLAAGFQSSSRSLLSLPNSFWSVGPDVTMPLFDGGNLDAQEAAAYARFREVSATYRSTVLSAFQQVEDNLALLHWLGQESVDQEAGAKAAQQTLDNALSLYREGANSYLEVVTAQTALLQAQQGALDLQTRRLTADVGLIRALGGGWDGTELPSDAETIKLPANTLDGPARDTSSSPATTL